MAASTVKKVVVRRFDREPLRGVVSPSSYLRPDGLELLTMEGMVSVVPYSEVKAVCFVKDFDADPPSDRKVFNTRPKMDGLWVRMRFRDGDEMEGILSNNLLQVDPFGYTVTPPDPSSNNQRLFVPRLALVEMAVLGVVGSPARKPRKPKEVPKEQIRLFDQEG